MKKLSSTCRPKHIKRKYRRSHRIHQHVQRRTIFLYLPPPWFTDLSTSLKLLPDRGTGDVLIHDARRNRRSVGEVLKAVRKLALMRILLLYSQATRCALAHPCPSLKKGVSTTAAFVSQPSCDGLMLFLPGKDAGSQYHRPSSHLANSAVVNFHKTKLTAMTSGPS